MNNFKLILPIATALLVGNALADSWTITQEVTVASNTDVLQKGTGGNSVQAINSINLDGTNGTVNSGSTQHINIQEYDLKLEQSNNTAASSQAVNRVYAKTINGIQQSITTNGGMASGAKVTLLQASTVSDGNIQSVNAAVTSPSGEVSSLTQAIATTNHTMFYQQLGGNSNTQAGNLIKSGNLSATASNVTQSHTAGYASFLQSNTDNSIQAGNALLMIAGQSGGTLNQEFSSNVTAPPSILYMQTSTNGSIQSMNYAGDEL